MNFKISFGLKCRLDLIIYITKVVSQVSVISNLAISTNSSRT